MRAPRRHGLTMIELLAALVLLALVIPAALTWTTHTVRVQREASDRSAWHASAEAVLQLIHDDLQSGDFVGRMNDQRVLAGEGGLQIRTRDRGEVVHRYEYEQITQIVRRVDVNDETKRTRTLLTDVSAFDVNLNFGDHWFEVEITGPEKQWSVSRRYAP